MALIPIAASGSGQLVAAGATGLVGALWPYLREYIRNNDVPTIAGHAGNVYGSGVRALDYFRGNATAAGPAMVSSIPVASNNARSYGLPASYYAPAYYRRVRRRRRRNRYSRGRLRRFYRLRRRGLTAGGYFVRRSYV